MPLSDPVSWPINDLAFFAEHNSWQESVEPAIADFPTEVGPSKRRRRTYLPSTRLEFHRIISSAHLEIFLDFFETDLRSGVFNFTANDPRTGLETEYQFLQVPSWRDVSPGYWRLQFSLRRVNLPPSPSVITGNDAYTKILLHFEGSPGSQVIRDSALGGHSHVWTAQGDAQISSASPQFGGGALALPGSGPSYIWMPAHADIEVGDDDFTIDTWFECAAAGGTTRGICGQDGSGGPTTASLAMYRDAATNAIAAIACVGASVITVLGTTPFTDALNTGRHHAAFVRDGDLLKLFLDGEQEAEEAISGSVNAVAADFEIGSTGEGGANVWEGGFDEFRFSSIARWGADFTPPVQAYVP